MTSSDTTGKLPDHARPTETLHPKAPVRAGLRLAIDFGTSNTTAVTWRAGGLAQPVLFEDGSPVLPSGVYAAPDGSLETGRAAQRMAVIHPGCFEPYPKQHLAEGTELLGEREVDVVDLVAAVLRRVADQASPAGGTGPSEVVLSHPDSWSATRISSLREAATRAGLPEPRLVSEPVAAATHFIEHDNSVPVGGCVMVYDLGAGTFDATVMRRTGHGPQTLATEGVSDLGGRDLDAMLVEHVGELVSRDSPAEWHRLRNPKTEPDRRARWQLWEGIRQAKEQLSRSPSAVVHVPLVERVVPITREEFERLARPILGRTVAVAQRTLQRANVEPGALAGVVLVGGASRIPLVATLLHQALKIPPVVVEQPELVVAQGAVLFDASAPDVPEPEGPPPVVVIPAVELPPPPRRVRTGLPYLVASVIGVIAVLASYLVFGPAVASAPPAATPSWPAVTRGVCASPIKLSVAVSVEKLSVMKHLTDDYDHVDPATHTRRLFDGRCADVSVFGGKSGYTIAALSLAWDADKDGGPMPDVLMPAASTWLYVVKDLKNPPVNRDTDGRLPSVVRTPLVLAVPQEIAQKLSGQISWADLQAWADGGHADLGKLNFVKTNPGSSTSGLHATIATYISAAATHHVALDSTAFDAGGPVRTDITRIENTVAHYGETTLDYLTRLATAPDTATPSVVALEEKSVYDYNSGRPDGDLDKPTHGRPAHPLVALYPSDGTLVSDDPYMILSKAGADQNLAARDFLHFLLDAPQQNRFRSVGFRGADDNLATDLLPDNGLRPDEHVKQLPLPAPAVLQRIQDTWKDVRKPARILLALDVSGSMLTVENGVSRLDGAKGAARKALTQFSADDEVGLWTFSGSHDGGDPWHEAVAVGRFKDNATELDAGIDKLASKAEYDTALYVTIRDAYTKLYAQAADDAATRDTAIVVLTDGQDDWHKDYSRDTLVSLLQSSGGTEHPVRVFPIAYGHDADFTSLQTIATASGGKVYDARDPYKIDQVMTDVINNF